MDTNYEFRSQSVRQKAVLVFIRAAVLVFVSFMIFSLGWAGDADVADTLVTLGSVLTLIWIHSNLLQVKVEIQELFVYPYNTLNGAEYLLTGFSCFVISWFL